jgi:glycerol-3-phosphate dehydrogenase
MYPERLVLANLLDGQTAAAANNVSFDVFTYHTAVRHDDHVEVVSELGETTKRFQPALIVNATGAWVDETLKKLKIPSDRLMGGTKGTHFITFQPALVRAVEDGGFYVEAGDGRPVFFLKFGEGVLVGTTDLRVEESPQDVLATEPELEYLVDAAQRMFPTLDFKREDIAMYYCGVRPLPHVPAGSTASITRRHFIRRHSYDGPPTMSVVGGKLTTARALGEEAAAVILNELGRQVVATSGDRPLLVGNYLDDSDHEVDSSAGSSMERFEAESGFNSAEVSAMWSLVGSSLSSYLGGPGNDSGNTDTGSAEAEKKLHKSKLLDGTPLSYEFIKGVIRREWVTKLDDLVERRLMLLYHPCLRRETIVQLSHLLVECGALHEGQVEDSVERCVERMRTRYGRRLDGS